MRRFLVAALRDWVLDNEMTPHLKAKTQVPGVVLPQHLIAASEDVVLNISAQSVADFCCEATGVSFKATFGGVYSKGFIPYAAIEAIYAKETGRGMALPEEFQPPDDAQASPEKPAKDRSHLRVVK